MTYKVERSLFVFVGVLSLFLVAQAVLVVKYQRDALLDRAIEHSDYELGLLATSALESMLRNDYFTVQEQVTEWGRAHDYVVSITAVSPSGFNLSQYNRETQAAGVRFERSRPVMQGERELVTLHMVGDSADTERYVRGLNIRLVVFNVVLLSTLGAALWYSQKKTAIIPLQNEIARRLIAEHELEVARDHLEDKVRERTSELTVELLERRRAEEALRKSEEELRKLNEELEFRVAARTAELQTANKELEAFSYSVSHDLRGPLRAIDGFSQALLEDYGSVLDGDAREYLSRVRAASLRMSRLIDDMLKLSRVTRSDMKREPVDLSAIVREIGDELVSLDTERVVRLDIADTPSVIADLSLMRIMLDNLMRNAWKFTSSRAEGVISFGAFTKDAETVYYVKDNGVGFDMAYVDKLFKAFQRLHSESQFPGTGIGLATVQRIVSRHGGKVWAEGKPDIGTTICFSFHSVREAQNAG